MKSKGRPIAILLVMIVCLNVFCISSSAASFDCTTEEQTVKNSPAKMVVPERDGEKEQVDTNYPERDTAENGPCNDEDKNSPQSNNSQTGSSTNNSVAFTPNGNLSLVDDVLLKENEGESTEELPEKQFVTVQSKSGNYFYLVIDRAGESENVYFLNLVDEADLMALIEKPEDSEDALPVCSCSEKCMIGLINTTCEVCRTNFSECVGEEPETPSETDKNVEPIPDAEEPIEKKSNVVPIFIVVFVVAAVCVVFYCLRLRKDKPNTAGNSDLDDYDYGQDDEDEETEYDDADLMCETEFRNKEEHDG